MKNSSLVFQLLLCDLPPYWLYENNKKSITYGFVNRILSLINYYYGKIHIKWLSKGLMEIQFDCFRIQWQTGSIIWKTIIDTKRSIFQWIFNPFGDGRHHQLVQQLIEITFSVLIRSKSFDNSTLVLANNFLIHYILYNWLKV